MGKDEGRIGGIGRGDRGRGETGESGEGCCGGGEVMRVGEGLDGQGKVSPASAENRWILANRDSLLKESDEIPRDRFPIHDRTQEFNV